jgi:non-specific serine/threonine protein kinase
LKLSSERLYPLPTMTAGDAVGFFCERAAAVGVPLAPSPSVDRLCERLDRLPLALQLAAARLGTFSPEQLLDRLATRLDLLSGIRDLEPRQQTLRATIEWSHELLTPPEQSVYRRLAVFTGGCTLEAAEAVCDADADTIQGLIDKSLVQRADTATGPRFWMLDAIGEYAAERLRESSDADELPHRHAAYFRHLAAGLDAAIRAGEPEEHPVGELAREIVNLRTAVAYGLRTGDTPLVREITASLPMYWTVRGLHGEGRSWIERALALDDTEDDVRRRLLSALATAAFAQGDHDLAITASDEAASLAMRLGGVTEQFELLKEQANAAVMKGELEAAERLLLEGLDVAIAVDNGVGTSSCRLGLVYLANRAGDHSRAQRLLDENLAFVRGKGQTRCEAYTLANLAETTVLQGRPQDCAADALLGGRRAFRIDDSPLAVYCLDLFATAAAARGDGDRATRLLRATESARAAMGLEPDEDEAATKALAVELLGAGGQWGVDDEAVPPLDLGSALALAEAADHGLGDSLEGEPPGHRSHISDAVW